MWQGPAHSAAKRAIDTMWEHYQEPITLVELADAAILSRFYFSRVFRDVTGTSPGRFLAAIRLHQAKTLLRQTSMGVTDISYEVGYNSPGTFTSRFTRSVGMSPSRYREYAQAGGAGLRLRPSRPDPYRTTVYGGVSAPPGDALGPVYVAAFNSAVPEGPPVACHVVGAADRRYRLDGIPDGVWYVRAASVPSGDGPPGLSRSRLLVGTCAALVARPGQILELDITLRESGLFDLPVLLALPDVDRPRERPLLQTVG
jgi:AraC family transcriptional regulator